MKKWIVCLLAAVSLSLLVCLPSRASQFNFSAAAVLPENQIDTDQTYFDLLLAPGESQELTMLLKNDTANAVRVAISVNSAVTNTNGLVEYGESNISADRSLVYNIRDLAEYPDEVQIPADTTVPVIINVNMPNVDFPGVIAGGITFWEIQEDETVEEPEEEGLTIKNEYTQVLALLMRQTAENGELDLILPHVEAGQVNYRNTFLANLQNPMPVYLKNLVVEAKVTQKGEDTVLYQVTKTDMQMAPNTNFNFPISLNGDQYAPGEYQIQIEAYAQEAESGAYTWQSEPDGEAINYLYHWSLNNTVSIANEEAEVLNTSDVSVTVKEDNRWLYLAIGIGVLAVLLLLTLIILIIKKRSSNKAQESKNNK